ncbi:MAG: ArnT family glycosyltransferase [Psychrobium sp.]
MANTVSQPLRWLLALGLSVLLFRLMSLGFYPLYDTTEARYGEIARIMLETGNWVTPQFDYNIPFWGKPPFQTWISGASFGIFGVNEFAARLPHFLCNLVTLGIVYRFAKQTIGKQRAIYSVIVLSACIGFTITAGTVMTDSALLMATTLAMTSYWRCYIGDNRTQNGLLFFAALSLGMLIKGPVAVVIIGIALVTWSISQRCFIKALSALPWFKGMGLFLALTLPWYIWAEIRSPGFFEYFIIGEHIQRFLVSGWQGDLYGTAHKEPRGMIWIFWLAGAFPWSFLLITRFFKAGIHEVQRRQSQPKNPLTSYLCCWMLAPLFLFTMSGNILPAYVLPGIAAMGLLTALLITSQRVLAAMAIVSYALLVSAISWVLLGKVSKKTEKSLLSNHIEQVQDTPLYYWKKRPFSAQFYSKGHAKLITDGEILKQQLLANDEFYIAIAHTDKQEVEQSLVNQCSTIERTSERILLHCRQPTEEGMQ